MHIIGVGLVWHGGTEESVEIVNDKVTSFHVCGIGIAKEYENNYEKNGCIYGICEAKVAEKIGDVDMYQELKGNENFSDKYATWIIAYCLDTDSFFVTNQRHFFWEYDDEFQCENDAINYFRNHLNEFRNARKEILSHCGGWSIDKDLFLKNTKERFQMQIGE